MSSLLRTRQVALVFLGAALALSSCSKDRTSNNTNRLKDGGQSGDGGGNITLDSGLGGDGGGLSNCNSNPHACYPGENRSSAPACDCLGTCSNGGTVVPNVGCPGFLPDSGVSPGNDAGPVTDGGTASGCQQNSECTGTGEVCVETDTNGTGTVGFTDLCNGACVAGGCIQSCTGAFSATTGCPLGQACTYLGSASTVPSHELCFPEGTGGEQAMSCTAAFDPGGQYAGDDCNRAKNFVCEGFTDATAPNGQCTRFCNPTGDTLCATFGNFVCTELQPGIGLCLSPPSTVTDLGAACPPATCQGVCSAELGNTCGADCSGLNSCPASGICLISNTGVHVCGLACTVGAAGDNACHAVNAALTCQDVGGSGACLP